MRAFVFSAFALAALSVATIARADPANEAMADSLFEEGVRLVAAGSYAEGCAKLAESHRLDPQLGTLLNLADCHEKEGRIASAWSEYKTLVDFATRAGDAARIDYANKRIAALAPSVPHASLTVPASVRSLTLDGAVLGRAAWSAPLPLDPGAHTLEITDANGQTRSQRFDVTSGAVTAVAIETPTAPVVDAPPASAFHTAGFVVGGIGIAAVLGGLGLGAAALGEKSTVTQHCDGPKCDSTGFDAQDSARSLATASTITFIAGAALIAGGIAIVLLTQQPHARASAIR